MKYISYTVHYKQPDLIFDPKSGPNHNSHHICKLDDIDNGDLDFGKIILDELKNKNVSEIKIYVPKEIR